MKTKAPILDTPYESRKARRCKECGQFEKLIAGGFYTTISPNLGLCADCINRILREEEERRRR